jgi:hypothetical protein
MSATLQHESSPERIGGAVVYGVEIFTVTERGIRERPLGLSSKVYHCIGHGQPRIVVCKYTRRSRHFTPWGLRGKAKPQQGKLRSPHRITKPAT